MIGIVLLFIYFSVAAMGLVLCCCAYIADPSPRALVQILIIGVPMVMLWPGWLVWRTVAVAIAVCQWLERRLSAR